MEILTTILPFVPVAIIVLAIIVFLVSSYVKAPPDVAYIISGMHKKPRVLAGKAGIKIPFLERMDKLALGAIQIDVKTGSAVPTAEYINVRVDSTVSVRVGQTDEMIALAAQNFLNVSRADIAQKINDLLEGNIREIVGQMKLTEMVGDRKAFSEKVQENAVPDLARFGLELVSFNVQNFSDDNDVITNLGIDNVEQIRKDAAIAKSNAQREIAVAEAENAKASNDARVKAAGPKNHYVRITDRVQRALHRRNIGGFHGNPLNAFVRTGNVGFPVYDCSICHSCRYFHRTGRSRQNLTPHSQYFA